MAPSSPESPGPAAGEVTQPALIAEHAPDSPARPRREPSAPPAGTPSSSSRRTRTSSHRPGDAATPGGRYGARPEDEGAALERRVARVEFAEGALVRLRVPVRADAESGRDVLTDIDVLAIDIDLRLRTTRSISECKSGQGQAKEPDRLFWLSGLARFVGADRATLVRRTARQRGREIAVSLGLQVLDIPQLEAREAAHAWLPSSFAHVGGTGCREAEARADEQVKDLGYIPSELVAFLRHGALLARSDRALASLVSLEERLREGSDLPAPLSTVLASHALMCLLLAAVADAQALDQLRPDEMLRRLRVSLTVGGQGQSNVLEILGAADQIVHHYVEQLHRQYSAHGAARRDLPIPSLRTLVSEPPEWLPRYMDLLQELRGNPTVARDLPQTAELACFDAIVGDSAYLSPAFDHLFTPEHRQLLRVAVRTLRAIIGASLTDRLGADLANIEFVRRAPALPDRRGVPVVSDDASVNLAEEE